MNRGRAADRVRHYDGERLTAADLNQDTAYESWCRALHVRAVHDTWGVALGFDLVPAFQPTVRIGPGLAYDACAREILLSEAIELVMPGWAPGLALDLVCSYRPAERPAPDAAALCLDAMPPPRPTFRWVNPQDTSDAIRRGVEIKLGTYVVWEIPGTQFWITLPSLVGRDWARAAIRPRMDSGVLRGDQVTWQLDGFQPVVHTDLDTGGSGFMTHPHYFASLLDNPWHAHGSLPPVVSTARPSKSSVRIQLVFLDTYYRDVVDDLLRDTSVLWFGIEPFSGLWPTIAAPAPPDADALGALRTQKGTL